MTAIEKKQKLIERIQAMPDNVVDDAATALDAVLEKEQQRREQFEQLLAKTSEKYREVWKALA